MNLLPIRDEQLAVMESEHEARGWSETPFHKDTLIDLVHKSDMFSTKINELASDMEIVEEARRAWRGKALATTSSTGD